MAIEVFTEGVVLDEASHTYTLDGKRIPGCTSIIQGVGLSDFSQVPKYILEKKSALGTRVHNYTHWWDENDLDIEDLKLYPVYYNRLLGWTQFRQDWGFKPLVTEVAMAIRVNGMTFGVTPDRFGVGNFGPEGVPLMSTVEIKNTVDMEPSHRVQTAAQALALKEDAPIPGRIICQLLEEPDKSGRFYKIEKCEDPLDERIFLAALALETWKRNNKIIK